jgi:hypothetical protein
MRLIFLRFFWLFILSVVLLVLDAFAFYASYVRRIVVIWPFNVAFLLVYLSIDYPVNLHFHSTLPYVRRQWTYKLHQRMD